MGLLPAERTRCLRRWGRADRPVRRSVMCWSGRVCCWSVLPGQCWGAPHLASGHVAWLLFPSSCGDTCISHALWRRRACSKWGLCPTLQVHLVEHPQTKWKISARSRQLLPGTKFTSSGLLAQGWKEVAGYGVVEGGLENCSWHLQRFWKNMCFM